MQKTLRDLKTKPKAGDTLMYQPAWSLTRNNPAAYSFKVTFLHWKDDESLAIILHEGVRYFALPEELRPMEQNDVGEWQGKSKEREMLKLLERSAKLKREIDILSWFCLAIAFIILIVLVWRR